jgi:hypothetical protein
MNMFARLVLALKGLLGQKAPSAAVTATPVYKYIGTPNQEFPPGVLLLAAKCRRQEHQIWVLQQQLEAAQASVRINSDIARDAFCESKELAKALKKSGKRNSKLSVKNRQLENALAQAEGTICRLRK